VLREGEAPQAGGAAGTSVERVWRCAACGAEIALDRDRIPLEGAATRAFVNPAGIEFVICGFREAAGCGGTGERSDYWSWFPGFSWQTVVCRGCGAHLGWSFANGSDSFYGLVLDRLSAPSA
jgi:hypothetical protein